MNYNISADLLMKLINWRTKSYRERGRLGRCLKAEAFPIVFKPLKKFIP